MQNKILTILNVPVFIGELPSGALKIWHPFNDRIRREIEPICRGKGRWHPGFKNWIVFSHFKNEVIAELNALEKLHHG